MSAALAATVPPSAPAPAQTSADRLSHLKRLEAEAIHIFRETVAETENPVMRREKTTLVTATFEWFESRYDTMFRARWSATARLKNWLPSHGDAC